MRVFKRFWCGLAMIWLALSSPARADMTIEVVGVGSQQYPIAIVPFQYDAVLNQPVTPVLSNDLTTSGRFNVISPRLFPAPYEPKQIDYAALSRQGAQAVLTGSVFQDGDKLRVRYWLVDVATRKELIAFERQGTVIAARRIGHQIADQVLKALTGDNGMFDSRIAYVLKVGRQFELQVADADGYGAQRILGPQLQPIMSPKWSPDGMRLAYVSFEQQKPVVYVHNMLTGKRITVANFWGSNTAPAWSHDGKHLAVVLSKEGGSQIFLINADGSGEPRRLTFTGEINTEPAFTPDGKSMVFTSGRGGSPQIYRMDLASGDTERLTMQGAYNASGKLSPDGRFMTFVSREDGNFHIAILDLETRQISMLTDTDSDDSPSFAPNGRLILYDTIVDQRHVLAVVSSDGRVKQRLKALAGQVRQPAWGPLLQ
jgi:TolB protein